MDSYKKLSYSGPVLYEDFLETLKVFEDLKLLLQRMSMNCFLKCSGKMIAHQWVISCEYATLQNSCRFLTHLEKESFEKEVLKRKVCWFAYVDIDVPDKLHGKFSEMVPLFVVQEIPDCDICEKMKMYKEKIGRKAFKGTKKLLGVMKAKKILLYTPMIHWYLEHGLRLTAVH